jgi:hypothetical protein
MADIGKPASRAWLNAAESRLVASSRGAALSGASVDELRRHVVRARAMRDKWRDVYMKQRRETQQARAARATGANRRSRDKSELFGQVLARLEARLAKLLAAPATTAAPISRGNPSKRTRTRTHRQTRTRARQALADQVAERQSETVRREQAALPPMQTRTVPRKPSKKREPTKKTVRKQSGRPARSSHGSEKARPQSLSAAARHRTKVSGLTTRIRGHVSGRGKRDQARRDRRR